MQWKESEMDHGAFVNLFSDIGELGRAGHTTWRNSLQVSLYPLKIHIDWKAWWNGYFQLKWLLFWCGASAWQAQVELRFCSSRASRCRQAPVVVQCVIWDGEQRAQHSGIRWFSTYIREKWLTSSPAKKSDLNPLQQVWGEILSSWFFISFGCRCHLGEQELMFYQCSWQICGFLRSHWCCKNTIDEILGQNPPVLCSGVFLVSFLKVLFFFFYFMKEGLFLTMQLHIVMKR